MSPEPAARLIPSRAPTSLWTCWEESIEDAVVEVKEHIQTAKTERDERRAEALTLAMYKMSQLSVHMHKSRRILNDLRTIRRLLFQERGGGD